MAPGEYVRQDKWKVIRLYNTGHNARLDAEDREYDQYQKLERKLAIEWRIEEI